MEPFHNFSHNSLNKGGVLVSRNVMSPRTTVLRGTLYFPKSDEVYLINRYSPTNMIEYVPEDVGHMYSKNGNSECDISCIIEYYKKHINYTKYVEHKYKNKYNAMENFIRDFKIDLSNYDTSDMKTLDDVIFRNINPAYRPIYLDEAQKNNIILSPIDSRVKMFSTKEYLPILRTLFNFSIILPRKGEEDWNLIRGNGFISRVMPQDDRCLFTPYDGKVTRVYDYYNKENDTYMTAFKIENDYFMPPRVLERDQFSVVYGKCLHFNRGCSERLEQQPDSKLVLYMIVIGSGDKQPIVINNRKIPNQLNKNSLTKTKFWLNKGDKIGNLDLSTSFVTVLSNRGIQFTPMLSHTGNENMPKYREHMIKSNDLVGYIQ